MKYEWISYAIEYMEDMVAECCDIGYDFMTVKGEWMYGSFSARLSELVSSDKYIVEVSKETLDHEA